MVGDREVLIMLVTDRMFGPRERFGLVCTILSPRWRFLRLSKKFAQRTCPREARLPPCGTAHFSSLTR
jgi:hypothetical protein